MNSERHTPSLFPNLGLGMGLRASHFSHILDNLPAVDWFEAVSENFMGIESGFGGRPLWVLEKIRENYPLVLHGVSLSIGTTDPLDFNYLRRLKTLVDRFEPRMVSDHLCWTSVGGRNLHDLLPLPFTEQALTHLVNRVEQVQNFLGRRILLENVSSYLTYAHSQMTEWEFLSEISRRADCGILLDVNNIYVSSVNHSFDATDFLEGIPAERVGYFHLAGYSDMGDHLIDTHDHAVSEAVWKLYGEAVKRFPQVSTCLERDANVPPFEELHTELKQAGLIRDEVLASHGLSFKRVAAPNGPSLHAP